MIPPCPVEESSIELRRPLARNESYAQNTEAPQRECEQYAARL